MPSDSPDELLSLRAPTLCIAIQGWGSGPSAERRILGCVASDSQEVAEEITRCDVLQPSLFQAASVVGPRRGDGFLPPALSTRTGSSPKHPANAGSASFEVPHLGLNKPCLAR